jgi:small subunit ribosomal protein S15
MARMYSRKKGKSRSYKPVEKKIGSWMTYKPKEVELLVIKLAKGNQSPSQIGLHLRDHYGIPDVKTITEKSISEILKEKKLLAEIPEDVMALLKKEVFLNKHVEKNIHDESAIRGRLITQSKIRKLVKYYKNTGRLPIEWKYNPKEIALLIE